MDLIAQIVDVSTSGARTGRTRRCSRWPSPSLRQCRIQGRRAERAAQRVPHRLTPGDLGVLHRELPGLGHRAPAGRVALVPGPVPAGSGLSGAEVQVPGRDASHADLLKLAHPGSGKGGLLVDDAQHILFKYIRKLPQRGDADLSVFPLIVAHDAAHATRDVAEWVRLINTTFGLSWRCCPARPWPRPRCGGRCSTATTCPSPALVRNLPRLTNLGLLKPMGKMTADVCARLVDAEALVKARIHPMKPVGGAAHLRKRPW